jgi:streptogramin lyase
VSRTSIRRIAAASAVLAIGVTLVAAAPAIAAPTPQYSYYATPTENATPGHLSVGPDGNLWFTEPDADNIGRITTAGVITEFPVPTAASLPEGITAGPDGNLWFTEAGASKIGMITPAGIITEYPVTPGSAPYGIVTGPDGNLWFTEEDHSKIGQLSPAGVLLNEAPIAGDSPTNIIVGSDNRLWFAEHDSDAIGAITTAGVLTEYPLTQHSDHVALGPDGNVWFTGYLAHDAGGFVTPAGVVTGVDALQSASALISGPGGDMWADDLENGSLNAISPAGVLGTTYPHTTAPAGGFGDLIEGPDHNLWFTVPSGFIGVLNFDPPVTKPVLATTGVGPASWVAGGLGIVAVLLGIAAVVVSRGRRRPALHRG